MMDILFVGGFYPETKIDEIKNDIKSGYQNAAHIFQISLLKGMLKGENLKISAITMPFIGYYPKHYKKCCVPDYNTRTNDCSCEITSLGYLNIPIIKNIIIFYRLKKNIKQWASKKHEKKVVLIYSSYIPFLKAALTIKKKYPHILVCNLITDIPGLWFSWSKYFNISELFDKLFAYRYIYRMDSYILLTKEMSKYLKIEGKPFLVIEGLYDHENEHIEEKVEKRKKVIFYSGSLNRVYGINELLQAFSAIDDPEYSFLICGDGDEKARVLSFARKDSRIKYLGVLNHSVVKTLQKEASILINYRPDNEEFVKYSFPSKTMEYLASGTTVAMSKLPGIPIKYYDYCYSLETNDPKAIAKRIIEIEKISKEDKNEIGKKARAFILQEKNYIVQAKKVLEFLINKT